MKNEKETDNQTDKIIAEIEETKDDVVYLSIGDTLTIWTEKQAFILDYVEVPANTKVKVTKNKIPRTSDRDKHALSLHSKLDSRTSFNMFTTNCIIERVENTSNGAVKVEPPVTIEVALVEDCTIRTEETVLGQASSSISSINLHG